MEVLQRTANRGSISTGEYEIDNSLKLEADNSEYMKRVMTATGNRKTFTISVWLKRTELKAGAADAYGHTFFLGGNGGTGTAVQLRFSTSGTNPDALQFRINTETDNYTNRVFRDTSAWYHIVLAVDTTQATDSNRLKLYVNGVQETSFATINYPTQNSDTQNNLSSSSTYGQEIGAYDSAGTYYGKFCGYLAEYNHVDGQQLAPTEFGETDDDSGIWKPKAYTGTYGTNGFYLDFADAADLGDDESGNGNDFTETNITAADQATDTPTNNFCTLLGQQQDSVVGTEPSIKEGGTTMFGGATSSQNAVGTMGVRSGKWYFESTITNSGGVGTDNHNFGVVAADQITALSTGGGNDLGYVSGGWAMSSNSAARNNNGYASGYNATSALAVDKIMGVAIDMDNGKIWWHREGTWTSLNSTVGNPANGTTPSFSNLLTATDEHLLPAGGFYINDNNQVRVMNFGGYAQAVFTAVGTYADANGYGSFAYQPPTGFYALCGKNLAEFGGTA